ncbi:MAG: TIGR02099 family protein, partial [Methylococcales bacterium]|nr:TIGR02099 family protein [Methylococcales bacterium]
LKAAINIDKQQNTIHSAHIVYGNGGAVIPKEKGIHLEVEQNVFDLSEWMDVGNARQTGSGFSKFSGISLNIKQLQWKEKNYGSFEIASLRFDEEWRGYLTCSTAKGAFAIPIESAGQGKIKLDLAYLSLSELVELDLQVDDISTEDLSLINVESEQVWWKGSNLGELKIETEKLVDGVRFKHINVISNNHKIELKADWLKTSGSSVTEMHGSIFADDIGVFLSQFGFANDLKEATANIEYYGSWTGSPYQFSLATMDGGIDVMLEDGRISSIEPGFGRVLGLIAMEQWIKRLTLDFGDVYKEGLTFNNISGHFNINKGKAVTSDLFVDAVPARMSIQ